MVRAQEEEETEMSLKWKAWWVGEVMTIAAILFGILPLGIIGVLLIIYFLLCLLKECWEEP
jgi:hypothetical protein